MAIKEIQSASKDGSLEKRKVHPNNRGEIAAKKIGDRDGKVQGLEAKMESTVLIRTKITIIAIESQKPRIVEQIEKELDRSPQHTCQTLAVLYGLKIRTRRVKAKKPIGFPH